MANTSDTNTRTISVKNIDVRALFWCFKCRVYSKKHVKKERSRERAELAKAWNLLDPLGKGEFSSLLVLEIVVVIHEQKMLCTLRTYVLHVGTFRYCFYPGVDLE